MWSSRISVPLVWMVLRPNRWYPHDHSSSRSVSRTSSGSPPNRLNESPSASTCFLDLLDVEALREQPGFAPRFLIAVPALDIAAGPEWSNLDGHGAPPSLQRGRCSRRRWSRQSVGAGVVWSRPIRAASLPRLV